MYATDISIAFDRHVLPYGIEGLSEPSRLEDAAREGDHKPTEPHASPELRDPHDPGPVSPTGPDAPRDGVPCLATLCRTTSSGLDDSARPESALDACNPYSVAPGISR